MRGHNLCLGIEKNKDVSRGIEGLRCKAFSRARNGDVDLSGLHDILDAPTNVGQRTAWEVQPAEVRLPGYVTILEQE